MPRLAGSRLKNATGKDEVSAADVVTTIAVLGGIGGLGVTGLAGLLDYFTGDARIYNSPEFFANSAITTIPLGATAAGLGAAMLVDPVAREMVGVVNDTGVARQMAAQHGGDAVMSMLTRGESASPNAAAVENAAQKVDARKERLIQVAMEQAAAKKKYADTRPDVAAEILVKRGAHRLARGAGLGALAGSVPAVMMMRDEEHSQ